MRTILKFLPVILMVFLTLSCDLLNVDVDKDLTAILNINVDEAALKSTEGVTFNEMTVLDLSSYDEYADKIVEVDVGNVLARVETVSEEGLIFYANTSFSVSDDEGSVTWTLDEDWPLEENTVLTLEDLDGIYDDLAAILLRKGNVTVTAVGECSKGGVFVSIAIDMETVITGNLLE